jgi:hypothetical protein
MDITGCALDGLVDDPLIGFVVKCGRLDRWALERLLDPLARERSRATNLADPSHPWLPATRRAL